MSVTQPGATLVQHNDRVIRRLVETHAARTDEPLVLAVRFRVEDSVDLHLLEVLEGFPGEADEPLFVTEFGPSAELVVLGKLQLVLASPAQLRSAIVRSDALVEELRRGTVLHRDLQRGAAELLRELGLGA